MGSSGRRLLAAVETACGSGAFRLDERLRVDEIRQRGDTAVSTARLSVRLDDAFDAEEARRRYRPDRRLIITTDEADAGDRAVLFEGYASVQTARWDGRIGQEEENYGLQAEHVFGRLSEARESLVYGRRVRSGEIEDGLASEPATFEGRSAWMTALPCVFNPDGVGNMATRALTVPSPAGGAWRVPVFTWDGAEAGRWTYAAALRYLVWFHLPRGGPVFAGNVFEASDSVMAGSVASDPLTQALARVPASLACEAMNLAEALALLASEAGIGIATETVMVGGRPVTSLRAWCAGSGLKRVLHLARGGRHADGAARYDASRRSARAVLADNNVYRGEVRWDHRGNVQAPVVIGDVKRYEVTLPLRPGWYPREQLDSVPAGQRAAARALALTPEQVEALGDQAEASHWFRRYHRHGSEYRLDVDVARLWVLNEDGRCDPAVYNRNPPFDDYRAFDFSTVADATVLARGGWMRRPRRLWPAISLSGDGRRLGVWVEISFDGGATWQQQSSGVRVLEDRAGIHFECDNPTEITPAGVEPATTNLWYAIVDQVFRVRVTAVIESDERLIGETGDARRATATQRVNGRAVRLPKAYQFVTREHTSNVLVPLSRTAGERDDTAAIRRMADETARQSEREGVNGLAVIPWIETAYAIGDRISEVRGRQLSTATLAGVEASCPSVVERRFVLSEGRYETQLVLGQ